MVDKTIARVQTKDEATNRSFDQVRQVVNPAMQKLQAGISVTGSKGGNAALASLISALAASGIITDNTT